MPKCEGGDEEEEDVEEEAAEWSDAMEATPTPPRGDEGGTGMPLTTLLWLLLPLVGEPMELLA